MTDLPTPQLGVIVCVIGVGACIGAVAWMTWQRYQCSANLPKLLTGEHSTLMSSDFVGYILAAENHTFNPRVAHCPTIWISQPFEIEPSAQEITATANLKDPEQQNNLHRCLRDVQRVNALFTEYDTRREEPFVETNPAHAAVLRQLWETTGQQEDFQLNSKVWASLGFQGKNPSSDFRGGGLLSAQNLASFAQLYPVAYQQSLAIANDDKTYAPHAVVGIHVTMFIRSLFFEGRLHRHLMQTQVNEQELVRVYCTRLVPRLLVPQGLMDVQGYLFYKLIQFWVTAEPENIFEYNAVEKKFFNQVRETCDQRSGLLFLHTELEQALQ